MWTMLMRLVRGEPSKIFEEILTFVLFQVRLRDKILYTTCKLVDDANSTDTTFDGLIIPTSTHCC